MVTITGRRLRLSRSSRQHTSRSNFRRWRPKAGRRASLLFEGRYSFGQLTVANYDVSPDGERFGW